MKTASQVLEEKGYDNEQQNDIVCVGSESLDWKVRDEFGIDEPIHLYECYYIGDANEDVINEMAKEKGYEDYKGLLFAMDRRLVELAEEYPAK